jgi:hypothetical protein
MGDGKRHGGSDAWWASDKPEVADQYAASHAAEAEGFTPAITPADISFKNPMVIDAQGRSFGDLPGEFHTTYYAEKAARERGHDGLVIHNVVDDGPPSTVYAAIGPNTVKSAHTGEILNPGLPSHSVEAGRLASNPPEAAPAGVVVSTFDQRLNQMRAAIDGLDPALQQTWRGDLDPGRFGVPSPFEFVQGQSYRRAPDSGQQVMVDLAKLKTNQPDVSGYAVKDIAERGPDPSLTPTRAAQSEPTVARLDDGSYMVLGGNHRLSAAALKGETTAPATLFSNAPDAAPVGMLPALANTSERRGITAFHGSPHDFDKFDAAHIGKGEGAQAYGHGLYFAEAEGVARQYRDALTGTQLTPEAQAWESMKHAKDRAEAARDARVYLNSLHSEHPHRPAYEGAVRLLESGQELRNPGRMYEVRLNAEPEQFLDWDKPLSQQSEEVRKAFDRSPELQRARQVYAEKFHGEDDMYGWGVFDQDVRDPSPAVSQALRDAGIAGIRYLDGMARVKGEGSVNYVIFPGNENLIDIVRKYANPPDAAPAGLLATDQEHHSRKQARNPSGQFAAADSFDGKLHAFQKVLVDLDGDGTPDAVVDTPTNAMAAMRGPR